MSIIIRTNPNMHDKRIAELQACQNPIVLAACYSLLDNFISSLPWRPEELALDLVVEPKYYGLGASIYLTGKNYDWITQQPETAVGMDGYECRKILKTKIGEFELNLHIYITHPLPDEDYTLYAMLGKIKYDEPYIPTPQAYIACEVPS